MAKASKFYRFRANPVEVLIFLAVTAVFGRSVYQLVYDPQVLTAMTIPAEATSNAQNRAPASTQSFLNLELNCGTNPERDTTASKVRLSGALCSGTELSKDHSTLVKTTISNDANKFPATVFTDFRAGKFSTDYIPLNTGKNPIKIEFAYRDGKIVTQEITIIKN